MGPDLGNKRHSSLKILFTSVLDKKRVNCSVRPLALRMEKEPLNFLPEPPKSLIMP